MNSFEKIKAKIEELESDQEKFYQKGNGAAGARLRKGLLEIKALASEGRKEISEIKSK